MKQAFARLDARRRTVVIVATLAMFAAVAMLARPAGPGEMALLYAGLDPAAAGAVVAALDARDTPYEVRGDAVYVAAGARDLERMQLAADGLPATGGQGYELLDGLSGFGTTAQMFDAATSRAREGELARTILAAPYVRSARVHIAVPEGRPFARETPVTAAVTVTTRGAPLSADQAQALRHLVAAAVPGLRPADVAVIDGEGGLVEPDEGTAPETRAEELRARAERLLEARVGPGNAVVEVSVETVTESESIRERTLDPDGRVVVSTESEESESTSREGAGDVTVASNLPDVEGAAGAGPASEEAGSRTLTNYELSETSREVLRGPGAVRRLTVAVLVNDVAATDAEGAVTVTPRPEAELAALAELVGAAVGLDAARGDVLSIKSMPFEPLAALGSEPAAATGAPLDLGAWVRPALLALVALGLGLFVVRPILRAPQVALLPPPALPAPGAPASGPASPVQVEAMALAPPPPEDPVARLRRLIEQRQGETAQILQSWIDAPTDAAAATAPRERA